MPVGGGSNLIVSDRPRTVAVSTSAFDLVEANGRKIYAGAGARLLEIMRRPKKRIVGRRILGGHTCNVRRRSKDERRSVFVRNDG